LRKKLASAYFRLPSGFELKNSTPRRKQRHLIHRERKSVHERPRVSVIGRSQESRPGYGGGKKRVLQYSDFIHGGATLLAMSLVVYFGSEMAVTKIINGYPKNHCSGSVTFWYR
jgi:hypothetical protein